MGYVAMVALGVAQFVDSVTDADLPRTVLALPPTAALPFACLATMPEEYRIRIESELRPRWACQKGSPSLFVER